MAAKQQELEVLKKAVHDAAGNKSVVAALEVRMTTLQEELATTTKATKGGAEAQARTTPKAPSEIQWTGSRTDYSAIRVYYWQQKPLQKGTAHGQQKIIEQIGIDNSWFHFSWKMEYDFDKKTQIFEI